MTMHESALEYARKNVGNLPKLASEVGVKYNWLRKFVAGEIDDPGVNKIERLLGHKNKSTEKNK